MRALIEAVPLEGKDWEIDLDILVVPLSLEEYWETFWADDAPYYVPTKPRDPDDVLLSSTNWSTPSLGYEERSGKPVLQERIYERTLVIRGNPLASQMHSTVYFSLLEKTDYKITIRTTAISDGAPYVTSCESWLKYEIITPDPRSKQVVMR